MSKIIRPNVEFVLKLTIFYFIKISNKLKINYSLNSRKSSSFLTNVSLVIENEKEFVRKIEICCSSAF